MKSQPTALTMHDPTSPVSQIILNPSHTQVVRGIPCSGEVYYNTKRGTIYEIIAVSLSTETLEEQVVVYKSVDDGTIYHRKLEEFMGTRREDESFVFRFVWLGNKEEETE